MEVTLVHWAALIALIIALLALDLGVLHREAKEIPVREAMWQSAGWIAVALLFNVVLFVWQGSEPALEYLTGYLIEKSLSVDNLFVFLLVFSYFAVPKEYQYRVLIWGVIGALVFRAIFIFAGVALLERFHWLIYVFGAFLIVTAYRMVFGGDEEVHPERNPVLGLVRRIIPVTDDYVGDRLFTRASGRLMATPLLVVLVAIETTDLVFAIDSIPAILAITQNEFIVFSSNAFAILGLRALFFALAGMLDYLEYLDYGLGAVLAFIGSKMLLTYWHIHVPVEWALVVVAAILALSVAASFILPGGRDKGEVEQMVRDAPPESPADEDPAP